MERRRGPLCARSVSAVLWCLYLKTSWCHCDCPGEGSILLQTLEKLFVGTELNETCDAVFDYMSSPAFSSCAGHLTCDKQDALRGASPKTIILFCLEKLRKINLVLHCTEATVIFLNPFDKSLNDIVKLIITRIYSHHVSKRTYFLGQFYSLNVFNIFS